jgi:lipopolysaccharide transport system permease protein
VTVQSPEVQVIQPQRSWNLGLREVWRRNELLLLLTRHQISVRYKQMLLGILWSFLEPLGQLVLLTLVFGYRLKVDTEGYPYALFAFAGLAPWFLFSRATTAAAGSLLDNLSLISKVYFPRLILPLAAVGRELADSLLMLMLLLVVAAAYGFLPTPRMAILPLVFLYAALIALACGLCLASLAVKFRDVRPVLSLLLQAGMFATPIVYSAKLVPEWLRFAYELNPMLWVVELSRWALLERPLELTMPFYLSLALVAAVLFCGLIVFSIYERIAVDVQ